MAERIDLVLDTGALTLDCPHPALSTAIPRDVAAAWRTADQAAHAAADDDRRAAAMGRQVRYALLHASVTSIANALPPALIGALVERGVWQAERTLQIVERVHQIGDRWQAESLARLLPYLDDARRAAALPLVLAAALDDDGWSGDSIAQWSRALPYLKGAQLAAAVDAVRGIPDIALRIALLCAAVPYLPDPLVPTMLEVAAATAWDDRAHIVIAVAPRLAAPDLPTALQLAQALDHPFWRVQTCMALVPFLNAARGAAVIDECLALTAATDDASMRAMMLAAVAQRVATARKRELLAAAVDLVCTNPSEHARVYDLLSIVPSLDDPAAASLLPDVCELALAIAEPYSRLWVLKQLVPLLPDNLRSHMLPAALACARAGSGYQGAPVLGQLAEYLPPQERDAVLAEALQIVLELDNDEGYQVSTLEQLAPYLPEALLEQAVAFVEPMSWMADRTWLVGALAPYLPARLLQRALAVVSAIDDPVERHQTYGVLQQYSATADPEPATLPSWMDWEPSALDDWQAHQADVAALAAAITPRLATMDQAQLRTTLDWLATLDGGESQVQLLAALAPRLSETQLTQVLTSLLPLWDTQWQPIAVAALSPWLPVAGLAPALALVERLRYENDRDLARAALAPRAAALGLERDAEQIITGITRKGEQLKARVACSGLLPEPQRATALGQLVDATAADPFDDTRRRALPELALQLARLPAAVTVPLWCRALHALARYDRSSLLDALAALAPLISALGGSAAIDATARAIADAGTWFSPPAEPPR